MSTIEASGPEIGRLAETARLADLRASAKGWHGLQLAVIGFIGLCGVLKPEGSAAPGWVEAVAGSLSLAALVLACLATYLVGRAAWPLYDAKQGAAPTDAARELKRTSRRLTTGLFLTFVAVAVLALGAATAWWPSDADAAAEAGSVEVQAQGVSLCGRLAEASPGAVRVDTAGEPVEVRIAAVSAIRPVVAC